MRNFSDAEPLAWSVKWIVNCIGMRRRRSHKWWLEGDANCQFIYCESMVVYWVPIKVRSKTSVRDGWQVKRFHRFFSVAKNTIRRLLVNTGWHHKRFDPMALTHKQSEPLKLSQLICLVLTSCGRKHFGNFPLTADFVMHREQKCSKLILVLDQYYRRLPLITINLNFQCLPMTHDRVDSLLFLSPECAFEMNTKSIFNRNPRQTHETSWCQKITLDFLIYQIEVKC